MDSRIAGRHAPPVCAAQKSPRSVRHEITKITSELQQDVLICYLFVNNCSSFWSRSLGRPTVFCDARSGLGPDEELFCRSLIGEAV